MPWREILRGTFPGTPRRRREECKSSGEAAGVERPGGSLWQRQSDTTFFENKFNFWTDYFSPEVCPNASQGTEQPVLCQDTPQRDGPPRRNELERLRRGYQSLDRK